MTNQNDETSDERFASASAYIAGEVAAGRAYCLGFDIGSRSCFGVLDGFGTLSFLADRPDGGVSFGHALKLPFVRGDGEAGARTIRDGVERVLESGRDAIVPDVLRGLGLDGKTRGSEGIHAEWSDRLSRIVRLIDWHTIAVIDRARIDGRLYRHLLASHAASNPGGLIGRWVVAADAGADLDALDASLPLAENVLRIAEATRDAPLPGRDRAWLRTALDGLEGLPVPPEAAPGVLEWLTGNPARSTVPDTRGQWQAFFDLHALRRMFERRTRLVLPRLTEAKGGDYLSLRDRISFGHVGAYGRADTNAIFEILWSPVRQFVDHVVHPIGQRIEAGRLIGPYNANAEAFAYGLMAGEKGLGALWELSNNFHARFPAVARALGRAVEGQGLMWEAAFPGILDIGGGWTAKCLTTPEELAAEGDEETGLDHCVGGYFPSCIRDGLVVVSVRRDGERVETMAFTFETVWRLSEHFGKSNAPPGEGYQRRFTAVAREIIAHRPNGMFMNHRDAASNGPEYDPNRPGAVEGLCEAFLPLLPRNIRAGGVEGVFDLLRAALPAMTPQGPARRSLCRWR